MSEVMDADVVVVGGGLAALRAAYDAAREGADVLMVVKGSAARSGSSAMTSAGYSTVVADDDAPSIHVEDTLRGSYGLADPALVEVMAQEAPARLQELVAMGAVLASRDGRPVVHPSGDHRVPRTVVAAGYTGTAFTKPLLAAALDAGVRLLERTAVVDLMVAAGGVRGAIGITYAGSQPALVAVHARSVVLATGGAGHLFQVTSNPNDATGDGYALALRAGAALRDMEFIQFYPWRCIQPFSGSRMPIQPSTFVHGARLYNRKGERFMQSYDADRVEATTRDIAARGIYDQIRNGDDVDGGVLLDLSDVGDAAWAESNPKPAAYFERRGEDFREVRMVLAPEAHFNMGGVVIDADGATSVPGLFAAGEAAGGVHGANRLDSNALPETQVFGARAGRAAANGTDRARDPDDPVLRGWHDRWASLDEGTHHVADLKALRTGLQETMWHDLGIVRSEERMAHGLDALDDLRTRLDEVRPADPAALRAWAELRNSATVCEASIRAARLRTESRGAHYRLDHPGEDPGWRVPITARVGDDGALVVAPADRVVSHA